MDIGEQTAGLGIEGWFEEGQEAVNAKAVVRRKTVVEVFIGQWWFEWRLELVLEVWRDN